MRLEKYREKEKKKIGILIFTICCILLVAGVFLYTSYAWYEENEDFNLINGTVEDPGDLYFAYYVDGVISTSMPTQNSGYTLDTEKSSCNNGVTITWDEAGWNAIANYRGYSPSNITRTKCTLYFVKNTKTVSTVLGNMEVNQNTPDYSLSSCSDDTCESHEAGIYETTDDDGTSYYYRGSVENNYVSFAGFYWRVIRINGNGSIRMIYDGTVAHANGESSTDRYFTTSKFNASYADNMYVGYMYTSGEVHGTGTSSVIKTTVDTFYKEKLLSYASYFDTESGFCGDRNTLNSATGVGTGTVTTYYSGYLRVVESTPTLSCSNSSDYYTVSSASSGNKGLTYPIGLITVDEMILAGHAGGVFEGEENHQKANTSSYLAIGNGFWTITPIAAYNPFDVSIWSSYIFGYNGNGTLDDYTAAFPRAVRPVINIKSSVKIQGEGTKTNPYTLSI